MTLSGHGMHLPHAQQRRLQMLSSLSKLTDVQIEEVRRLEAELGKTLLSFSRYDVVAANLSEAELSRVRELEKKIGTVLIALDPKSVSGV